MPFTLFSTSEIMVEGLGKAGICASPYVSMDSSTGIAGILSRILFFLT